jgi:hypothetical protein
MKNIFRFLILGLLFTHGLSAQEGFRVGGHVGIPVGDASDFSSLNIGVDATYLWQVNETLALGAASGFSIFMGKDDFSNYSFIPVAASARVTYPKNWFYVADLGYAVALEDGTDGGFFLRPKLGYTTGNTDFFIFYQSISESGINVSSFGAGVAFAF